MGSYYSLQFHFLITKFEIFHTPKNFLKNFTPSIFALSEYADEKMTDHEVEIRNISWYKFLGKCEQAEAIRETYSSDLAQYCIKWEKIILKKQKQTNIKTMAIWRAYLRDLAVVDVVVIVR